MCHTAYFNPRPPHGERRFIPDIPIIIDIFQSTPPHEERQATPAATAHWGATIYLYTTFLLSLYFNPRSRMGSDRLTQILIYKLQHFNPRSHMGSDQDILDDMIASMKFQSTLPHGERPVVAARFETVTGNFNPRSRMGSDSSFSGINGATLQFQSTLPHGERQKIA